MIFITDFYIYELSVIFFLFKLVTKISETIAVYRGYTQSAINIKADFSIFFHLANFLKLTSLIRTHKFSSYKQLMHTKGH